MRLGTLLYLGTCSVVFFMAGWFACTSFCADSSDVARQPVFVPENAHHIVLTDKGFVPAELVIAQGETVVFSNETGELFWPASNLHPSHSIYAEFDPLEPIQPTDVWSFTFTKVGEWKFHDHLAPYFTGVITVTEL